MLFFVAIALLVILIDKNYDANILVVVVYTTTVLCLSITEVGIGGVMVIIIL